MFDETPAQAWDLRFGTAAPELPEMGKFLNHRSVRKFKDEPIPEDLMQGLIAAGQSAATSSNLQLWSAIAVRSPDRREEIAKLCADQHQVRGCAEFLCFFADHYRLRMAAAEVGEEAEGLEFAEFYTMATIDASLAAERIVCAAESVGLGICYIGALRNDPDGVKAFFDLPEGVFGLFGLCLGWPEEPMRSQIKPRLHPSSVYFEERYPKDVDVSEYDRRMTAFYESQKMKGDVNWSMRSGRRVDAHHMTGREGQLAWLQAHGFLRK